MDDPIDFEFKRTINLLHHRHYSGKPWWQGAGIDLDLKDLQANCTSAVSENIRLLNDKNHDHPEAWR